MKKCKECQTDKPLSEYYVYRHGDRITYYARCKICHAARLRANTTREQKRKHRTDHRARIKAWVDDQKRIPCADCKKSFPPYVMDFDHVRGTKVKNIAHMVARATKKELEAEIAKCEVVCSNCHRERTHQRKLGN